MQFLIVARDGSDDGAFQRRMAVREEHIALGNSMLMQGRHLFGVAILNDEGKMIGSALVVDFPSRAALDAWLDVEPYVTANVWQEIHIEPCQVGPSFTKVLYGLK